MQKNRPVLAAVAILVAGCSSPPKPPTVDDSNKRPVNASQALDLQVCRSELTAAKIVLTESLNNSRSLALAAPPVVLQSAAARRLVSAPTAASLEPNQVVVVNFALGSADFVVPPALSAPLIEQARNSRFILIRGRTDAVTDSMAETRLAKRRAEAAYTYLVETVGLRPQGIRLTWQGSGDPYQPGGTSMDRQANRRVEIEMYSAKPEIQVLTPVPRLHYDLPRQVGAAESS